MKITHAEKYRRLEENRKAKLLYIEEKATQKAKAATLFKERNERRQKLYVELSSKEYNTIIGELFGGIIYFANSVRVLFVK